MKNLAVYLSALLLFSYASHATSPSQTVHKFIEAYNLQDADGMLAHATDDLAWLFFKDNQLTEMTVGKQQMKEELLKDFKNKKGGRSKLRYMFALNNTVSVIEEAFWEKEGELKSQCAISIYRFAQGLIDSVTYYDSAPCEQIESLSELDK